MSNSSTHKKYTHQPSALDKFSLSFEYDMSWHEAKKSLKERTA